MEEELTETLNPFEMLGDIELENMCKQWNTRSLLNMAQTHKRIQDVCIQVINKRKAEALERKRLEEEEKKKKPIFVIGRSGRKVYFKSKAERKTTGNDYIIDHTGRKVYIRDLD